MKGVISISEGWFVLVVDQEEKGMGWWEEIIVNQKENVVLSEINLKKDKDSFVVVVIQKWFGPISALWGFKYFISRLY